MKKAFLVVLTMLALVIPVPAAILQEDTAARVVVWFFDATTQAPKTGLTVTSITCRIVKSDLSTSSFSPTASLGSNDMVEIGNGAYDLELTSTQLNTAGFFEIGCSISGSASPPTVYDIYPIASYAVTIGGSPSTIDDFWEYAKASVTGTTGIGYWLKTNADVPFSSVFIRTPATAQAGGATSITLDASAVATDDFYNYKRLMIVGGTGIGQSAIVTDYVGISKVATTACEGTTSGAWRTNPDSTSVFVILPRNR